MDGIGAIMASAFRDNPIAKYLRGVRAEIRKVTWPTRAEVVRLSVIVMAVLIVMSAFMALVDYAFSWLMQIIVTLGTGL